MCSSYTWCFIGTRLINLNIISRGILDQTDKRVKIESPVMNTEEVEALLSKVDGIRVR